MKPNGKSELDSLYFEYPNYPFQTPPEMRGDKRAHPVVIVGAGPVGLVAALELARHDVPVVLLDDKASLNEGSRAICVSRYNYETFQQLGVVGPFEEKGLGWTHGRCYYQEEQIYRLKMPHSDEERFYPMYNIQQQYIEKYLADAAMASPNITVRWQSRVSGIDAQANGVTLDIETPEGPYQIAADHVLAADGARSVVRKELGLRLKGDSYEGRYLIADIQMQSDFPTERRAFFSCPVLGDSTVLIHKQPDNIWRIDYQVEGNTEEAIKEENVRSSITAILDFIGESAPWELEWWSIYNASTLCLDDYKHGRVTFIGDSAHLVPIFGVRGLNNGIADAVNAAWKLAYVIKGWAHERILESYTPERRGATLDVFKSAGKSTRFMTPPTRGYRLLRDAILSLTPNNTFAQPFTDPRQVSPYTYSDSPLTYENVTGIEFSGGIVAGAPIVNKKIGTESYLLDYLGLGFSGIYFSDQYPAPDTLITLLPKLAVGSETFRLIVIARKKFNQEGLTVIEDAAGTIFEDYGAQDGSFYLIRPDRHVCGRWQKFNQSEVSQSFQMALGGIVE